MTNHILKNESKTLHNLFKKLDQLHELNRVFALYVEAGIVSHCQVANLQNNCLIVIVDSANWATQLRFLIPDVIAKMKRHSGLENLQAICCKTRPDTQKHSARKKRPATPMQQLSAESADYLLSVAETLEDEKLRKIMKKIAGRVKV